MKTFKNSKRYLAFALTFLMPIYPNFELLAEQNKEKIEVSENIKNKEEAKKEIKQLIPKIDYSMNIETILANRIKYDLEFNDFYESILRKHNEHQLSIPIALSWLSYKFIGLPGDVDSKNNICATIKLALVLLTSVSSMMILSLRSLL